MVSFARARDMQNRMQPGKSGRTSLQLYERYSRDDSSHVSDLQKKQRQQQLDGQHLPRGVGQAEQQCVSGNECQKEISLVLRVCDASTAASCVAAREDLRLFCSQPMPWDGSRGCESALRQIGHYCEPFK